MILAEEARGSGMSQELDTCLHLAFGAHLVALGILLIPGVWVVADLAGVRVPVVRHERLPKLYAFVLSLFGLVGSMLVGRLDVQVLVVFRLPGCSDPLMLTIAVVLVVHVVLAVGCCDEVTAFLTTSRSCCSSTAVLALPRLLWYSVLSDVVDRL